MHAGVLVQLLTYTCDHCLCLMVSLNMAFDFGRHRWSEAKTAVLPLHKGSSKMHMSCLVLLMSVQNGILSQLGLVALGPIVQHCAFRDMDQGRSNLMCISYQLAQHRKDHVMEHVSVHGPYNA